MRPLLISCLLGALLGGPVGCKKDADAPAGLSTSFQLLNEQGHEATVFPQGQNLVFRLQIVNSTDQGFFLANPLFDTQQFLQLYRVDAGAAVSVGKPYNHIFCSYVGGYTVPAHGALTLTIPWVEAAQYPTSGFFCDHAANSWLPVGHYRTSFTTAPTLQYPDQPNAVQTAQMFTRDFDVQ